MTNLSRRKLLKGAIGAPIVASVPRVKAASDLAVVVPDELVDRAAEWIAKEEKLTAMHLLWQGLESDLFDKARLINMSCADAYQSDMTEARAMRTLDGEIDDTFEWLQGEAGEISELKATTITGAIAKIELGLKVQGPHDWRDHALELLEGGIAELRSALSIPSI